MFTHSHQTPFMQGLEAGKRDCSWRSLQIWQNGGGSAQPSGSCSDRSWNEKRRLWRPNVSVLSGKTTRRTGYTLNSEKLNSRPPSHDWQGDWSP